jgi:hypothetical protein
MSNKMVLRFTFSLALALTFADSATESSAQVPPPASGVYCNFNIAYSCPLCVNVSNGGSCRNASSALSIFLCDANGQRMCDNPVLINCSNGTWYDTLCGVNGRIIGTCGYYYPNCDINFASPKP